MVFSISDGFTFGKLKSYLYNNKLTISVCETFTSGMFVNKLTWNMHNPSTILRQSYIGFSNSFKINVMGVNKNIIRRHGTHSVECAKNIAYNLKERSASDISICIIGNPIAPDINIEETLDGHSLLLFNFSLRIPLRTCYAVIVFPDDTWDYCEINFNQCTSIKSIREHAVSVVAKKLYDLL